MGDLNAILEEWQQVLEATVVYLRTVASRELDYAAVVRIERNAWRKRNEILAELGAIESELSPATDELLAHAVSPASRQAVHEQVLGGAAAWSAPMDDGPEGVADDVNREPSEELVSEEIPVDEADVEALDEELEAEALDEAEEMEELEAFEEAEPEEIEEIEEVEDVDTAPPGTLTPAGLDRLVADDGAPEPEPTLPDNELDLESLEALDTDGGAEEDELPDIDIPEFDAIEDEATGEVERQPTPQPPPRAATPAPAPLIPDFDFDEEEEQDETVVFALGGGDANTAETMAALLAEASAPQADDSFDLMPAEEDEGEPLEAGQLGTDDVELDLDDEEEAGEVELESMDEDEELEVEVEEEEPEPAPLPARGRGVSLAVGGRAAAAPAGATAGLYGNPNVPTIRDSKDAPRAAAIQINARAGTGKMVSLGEEEEPLEIGAVEDYEEDYEEEDDAPAGGGFRLSIQEYEDEEEEEEEEEQELEPEPVAPVYRGPDARQVAGMLAQAQDAAARGDMQGGIDLFSDVLDADPDSVDAFVGRGRLYLDLGDYSRSMSDFMVAEDLAPESPEPQVAIGDLYFARKDYRKAIDFFNEALRLQADHAMAHCRRGISHYYRKNYSEALEDLRKAESLDADIPNIGTYISMAKKKAGKK